MLSGITYGFTFTGGGTAFDPGHGTSANNQNVTIRGVELDGFTAIAGDGNRITYDGTAATTLFENLVLDTCHGGHAQRRTAGYGHLPHGRQCHVPQGPSSTSS